MRVFLKPCVSNAPRMAPTRPSIMSEGATISAPASAWDSAWLHQYLQALIVQYVTTGIDDAVLAMGGIGIQSHVGDDTECGKFFLEGAHRAWYQAVGVMGLGGVQGFLFFGYYREQRQCGYAELAPAPRLLSAVRRC